MGQVISEGLENIGQINDDGYVFDKSGHCIARIDNNGYIQKTSGFGTYGSIDEDGTIRDSALTAIGRIQADGYVYIHSKRICKVSSSFIEKITPDAWNAGEPSSYSGRKSEEASHEAPSSVGFNWPFSFGTTIKLIAGVVLGIWAIIDAGSELGFLGCLIAIPVMVAMVFILCALIKFLSSL